MRNRQTAFPAAGVLETCLSPCRRQSKKREFKLGVKPGYFGFHARNRKA
jgi:hypothetical protein